METVLYLDRRNNEYVANKDPSASSDCYVTIFRGPKRIYIDTWEGLCPDKPEQRCRLDIAYATEEYFDLEHRKDVEQYMFLKNNFTPAFLVYSAIAEEKFDEYAKKLGLE